jgi:hypothetical protein
VPLHRPARPAKAGACGCTAKAGIGGPGERAAKAVFGGRATVLAWIGGSAPTFGWTDASFGWPHKNEPWITLALMIRLLMRRRQPQAVLNDSYPTILIFGCFDIGRRYSNDLL